MKPSIIIGRKVFKYKKDALSYFKTILNSYDYGETLNSDDFYDVYELLKKHPKSKEKIGIGIYKIKVEELRNENKGFYLLRKDSTTDFFSYLKCINGRSTPITKFCRTCREIVKDDIHKVKLSFFKDNSNKGKVKCQETGDLCKWEELVVDHRSPNTFSIIVDRFIEINKINIKNVEYIDKEIYGSEFADNSLSEKFRKYHKEKANKKTINQHRSHQGRIRKQKKDLSIK